MPDERDRSEAQRGLGAARANPLLLPAQMAVVVGQGAPRTAGAKVANAIVERPAALQYRDPGVMSGGEIRNASFILVGIALLIGFFIPSVDLTTNRVHFENIEVIRDYFFGDVRRISYTGPLDVLASALPLLYGVVLCSVRLYGRARAAVLACMAAPIALLLVYIFAAAGERVLDRSITWRDDAPVAVAVVAAEALAASLLCGGAWALVHRPSSELLRLFSTLMAIALGVSVAGGIAWLVCFRGSPTLPIELISRASGWPSSESRSSAMHLYEWFGISMFLGAAIVGACLRLHRNPFFRSPRLVVGALLLGTLAAFAETAHGVWSNEELLMPFWELMLYFAKGFFAVFPPLLILPFATADLCVRLARPGEILR